MSAEKLKQYGLFEEMKELYVVDEMVAQHLTEAEKRDLSQMGHKVILLGEAEIGKRYILAATESDNKVVLVSRVNLIEKNNQVLIVET